MKSGTDANWLVEKSGAKKVHQCRQLALGCYVSLKKKPKELKSDLKSL